MVGLYYNSSFLAILHKSFTPTEITKDNKHMILKNIINQIKLSDNTNLINY